MSLMKEELPMPKDNEAPTTVTETVATETTETQSSFDAGPALAEISSELFGQDSDVETKAKESAEGAEAAAAAEPSAEEPATPPQSEETSKEVQAVGAPTTWTKEAIEKWATLDPVVQQEVLKREQDMFKGLEEYKGRAEIGDQYNKVVEPYKPAMEKSGVNPVEMFGNFAANHYTLSFGTEDQKLNLAANLLENYDIDLIKLAEHIGSRPMVDPRVANLEREIAELKKGAQTSQTTASEEARRQVQATIDAFAADPKNSYFPEVANDIVALMNAGAALSLQEAYDKAVYANPITRQKEIDRLTAEKLAENARTEEDRKKKIAESTAAEVKTRENARDGTVPVGSMDDTLNETMTRIRAN